MKRYAGLRRGQIGDGAVLVSIPICTKNRLSRRSEIFRTAKSVFSFSRSSCLPIGHVLIKPERKDVGALWRSGGMLAELTDVE